MDSKQLKAWRAAQKLSQSDLASKLNISTAAVSLYERGLQLVPKTVELSTVALGLGIEESDGSPITIERYKLMSSGNQEWIEALGWRSRPTNEGIISAWMKERGHDLEVGGTLTVTTGALAFEIENRWR